MVLLIFAILFGVGFSYLAVQNTTWVGIHAGVYEWSLPLYLLIAGAVLVGLVVAWLMSTVDGVSSYFVLSRKDHAIKQTNKAVVDLKTRVHDLEIENAKLRGEANVTKEVEEERVDKPVIDPLTPRWAM